MGRTKRARIRKSWQKQGTSGVGPGITAHAHDIGTWSRQWRKARYQPPLAHSTIPENDLRLPEKLTHVSTILALAGSSISQIHVIYMSNTPSGSCDFSNTCNNPMAPLISQIHVTTLDSVISQTHVATLAPLISQTHGTFLFLQGD